MSAAATVIIGGGIAGLWLCDALCRRGDPVVLVESEALGAGQTIGSQGILHGGVKYALAGALSASAASVSGMPARWADALAGRTEPHLRRVPLRATHCHLWQASGLRSTLGMLGARLALEVTPQVIADADRPEVLAGAPGQVARLDEPVVDVPALLAELARRNAGHLFRIAPRGGVAFERAEGADVIGMVLVAPAGEATFRLPVRTVVLTAGAGNAALMEDLGLDPGMMQRRPLHMVMARGALPVLHGHCVDGARTRITVTTVRDARGGAVWQIGGQLAEDGVAQERNELLRSACRELEAVLPDFRGARLEWSAWRVDRAEQATAGGRRPDDAGVLVAGNVIAAWPTKLVLVPRLVDRLLEMVPAGPGAAQELPAGWPVPQVATPPWDEEREWTTVD